ncbi:hypothetical protein shim_29930 [Shimia sp. SK013]|uniref:ATP-grasp fold amidoligase family protein n=1 Tax=Shimia sp. SK013 TaxID=1389006 RepID=UPI0006B41768|nr:ATP-grasp fold amidoligase family protein [Shimia sp. SK013]KPA20746.1 hypothetical protein shim_29930 [Shimia sp. SK013]
MIGIRLRALSDWVVLYVVTWAVCLREWQAISKNYHFRRSLPQLVLPETYNGKVFWRKLFDHDPELTILNDKVLVRDWFAEREPDVALVPMVWHGPDPLGLPDELLTEDYVIKGNNGSGRNYFWIEGHSTREMVEERTVNWMTKRYGKKLGEWGYRDIPPQILVEKRLSFDEGLSPYNFNVHCSRGRVLCIGSHRQIADGSRQLGYFAANLDRIDLYMLNGPAPMDKDWQPSDVVKETLEVARRVSADHDYFRLDFMAAEDQYWFNEVTTYPGSGMNGFTNPQLMDQLTAAWDLRDSWFMRSPQSGWRGIYQRALFRRMEGRAAAT